MIVIEPAVITGDVTQACQFVTPGRARPASGPASATVTFSWISVIIPIFHAAWNKD
ncbi:MAG: hypothetical protein MZV63_21780 [Marinilabiliales bacterium]|nr:hypothetical protein [Marinilabiliales bacterium]